MIAPPAPIALPPVAAAPPVIPPAPVAAAVPPIVPPAAVAAAAPLQPPPVANTPPPPAATEPVPPPSGKPTDAVLIASFNIQVFGEAKLAKPQVVDVLTRVVRRFDVVAVQEVRAKSDSVVPNFVAAINADGSRYQYVVGPRLGRTSSKEQYTFIYDSTRIEIDPTSVATLPNPGDKLHRPPLRARFRVRMNPPEAGFSFWLVDIHTDPDEVPQEVDALADAFVSMRSVIPDEDDVILLGDLNAAPPQFGRIKQIPGIGWAVSGATTNTRRTKTYDNLVFDRTVTTEYTGRWGVLDLQQTFGLPLDKALEVSDHNPVWAAFSPWETQRIAGR
jgi:endonuclease/exonuclease/phosphatase family metal-dependent hydrolase